MYGDSAYTIFFIFGIVWLAMGAGVVIALLKADNQPIRFGKWGLLVALPIIIPLVAALAIAAILS